jgi:glucose-1-phosphate thymidylyltransferase
MKGIVLAGGAGTRLYPITLAVSKQLLPIYDKPMIYYPLSILMLAKIREILIITTEEDLILYKKLLGDGSELGMKIEYVVQLKPKGLAQAFILGEEFIDGNESVMVLGDNIFWGTGFTDMLLQSVNLKEGAEVYAYMVKDPERFGVVAFNENKKAYSLEEKPNNPKSNWAVTGLYFYDKNVCKYAKSLKPSSRDELEITDLNRIYLEENKLHVNLLGRGFSWLDTGTHDSLLDASNFVATIQRRQGYVIACLEEIAYNNKWIEKSDIVKIIKKYSKTEYGNYLKELI